MPQVTVYVRDEDLDKWKAIEKKSEFLHRALTNGLQEPFRNQVINIKTGSVKDAGLDLKTPGEKQKKFDELKQQFNVTKENNVKYCKNNHPLDDRGRCFGKGCKYS